MPLGSCVQWRVVREFPDVQHQLLITFYGNQLNLYVCKRVCSLNEDLGRVACSLFLNAVRIYEIN